MPKKIIPIMAVLVVCLVIFGATKNTSKDEWHYSDGSSIVCRFNGCGKTPVYSNWDDRYCAEHLDRSENHSAQYSRSDTKKKSNNQEALSKEEADALRGTGYNGTRPNSTAEDIELKAAMVKCKKCGMHSDNGVNSLCDACQHNEAYGIE